MVNIPAATSPVLRRNGVLRILLKSLQRLEKDIYQ